MALPRIVRIWTSALHLPQRVAVSRRPDIARSGVQSGAPDTIRTYDLTLGGQGHEPKRLAQRGRSLMALLLKWSHKGSRSFSLEGAHPTRFERVGKLLGSKRTPLHDFERAMGSWNSGDGRMLTMLHVSQTVQLSCGSPTGASSSGLEREGADDATREICRHR